MAQQNGNTFRLKKTKSSKFKMFFRNKSGNTSKVEKIQEDLEYPKDFVEEVSLQ